MELYLILVSKEVVSELGEQWSCMISLSKEVVSEFS